MSDWAAKRFWTSTDVQQIDGGFTVVLDGRSIKTPAKAPLVLPSYAMAQALAVEWDAQAEKIDPNTMPMTRAANAAIDKVQHQHAAVADMLAEYGGTDLLCYRADTPQELIDRQAQHWDPILDWAHREFGARLNLAQGVMFAEQPQDSLDVLRTATHAFDTFELTGFHDLVAMSGSLVLGFAVARDHLTPAQAWTLSRIDEEWQIEQWGRDEEADSMAAVKQTAFEDAYRFMKLIKDRP